MLAGMKGFLSRIGAIYLLSVPGAFLFRILNDRSIARMNGDPAAYVARQKELLMRTGPGTHFFLLAILGMSLVAIVEVVAWVIRGGWRESFAHGNSGSDRR